MTVAVRTEGLTKRYGSSVALDHLDLEIDQGEVFGYLGPNGAGKSTTISLLLGLIRPSEGSASIFGLDVTRDAPALHRRLAYVPSEAALWPSLTGEETLHLLGNLHGGADAGYRGELIERFRLDPHKKVRAYSHGNRQKVLLVAAFASRAELLLLDEPTTGLDPLMEQVFRDCVREARDRGQTVLLSSHILSEVEAVCDRVGMLRAAKLFEVGKLADLRGMSGQHVLAELSSPPPAVEALASIAGVANVRVDGQRVECDVTGTMGPLLEALGSAGIERLATRAPSLEELFVSRYGDAG